MKKLLRCTRHTNMIGVVYDHEELYTIDDGSVSLKVTTKYYLDQFKNKNKKELDNWVQEKIKDSSDSVSKQKGCAFEYTYDKDKLFVTILNIDEESVKKSIPSLSNQSRDEIYDKLKKSKESENYKCE